MRTLLISLLLIGCRDKADTDTGTPAGDLATDADGDGFDTTEDCDDASSTVNPTAGEICDGVDNNCDGAIDEGVTTTFYADADSDGYGDPGAGTEACEVPGGHVSIGNDCDDTDPDSFPGAPERCDGADNDCDDEVDEDVLSRWHADADADGHGDPDASIEDCDPLPGYVDSADDCDDLDASAYPGAEEVCDEADNDCDTLVDEGVTATYYQDADGDSFGVADTTTEACSAPGGHARAAGDCDDSDAQVSPNATELCDGADNDCDGDTDEDDAADADTFYADADSDGYGDAADSTVACAQPAGYVSDDTDCDDSTADASPGAAEVCDGADNDCDGETDEDSATDAATWHADSDGDGYGGASSTVACDQPSGFADNSDDCDDGEPAAYPGAAEVCDSIDNDCDGSTDEDVTTTYYLDADSDGYGDAARSQQACTQPSDYVTDGSDCDDLRADSYPGAAEVCDSEDNDCDGSTDEDPTDGETWYADSDGDGYGDPDDTATECAQPSGYVANAGDCDDDDATDTDGDGAQDCEDDDIDGDGLRNGWDAAPYDGAVARSPTGGLGGDGDLALSASATQADATLLDGGAVAGDTSVDVDDSSALAVGDEILILSQQGSGAGTHQFVFVAGISGDTLTIEPPLADAYSSAATVLVVRVPHYVDVDIASGVTLSASDWSGSGGGVVVFRAEGDVTVSGSVDASGAGFRGGDGVYGNSTDPDQGESYGGLGATGDTSANGGGGGAYPRRGDNGDSGGGGGYGSSGTAGTSYSGGAVTDGGSTYGSADLSSWFLGSGGGGGSPDTESDGSSTSNYAGNGGDGGGLVAIFSASTITVTGTVTADGVDGDDGSSGSGEVGGGGGGSGGQIFLTAPALRLSGTVSAEGGTGGLSARDGAIPYGSAYGGDGGDGRIALDADSTSGSTSPAAGSTGSYTD